MKASELIQKLQEQIELHGDLEVSMVTDDGDCECERSYWVSGVCFDDRFNEIEIH